MARSFYCNHCGKKVTARADKCPSCGRLFGAVLCPRCGFSGEGELFTHGCPACGYLEETPDRDKPEYGTEKKRPNPLLNFSPLFYLIGIGLLISLLLFFLSLL